MNSRWTVITPRRIPLREVWPHEQYDFSAWVKDNIDVVNEQTGLTVDPETLSPEAASGAFAADLVGTATDPGCAKTFASTADNLLNETQRRRPDMYALWSAAVHMWHDTGGAHVLGRGVPAMHRGHLSGRADVRSHNNQTSNRDCCHRRASRVDGGPATVPSRR